MSDAPLQKHFWTSAKSDLRKLLRLRWNDWVLLLRALVMLTYASFLIAFIPFAKVCKTAEKLVSGRAPDLDERARIIEKIRWAILAVARRVPWKAVCFQQALAAQIMLRHRGIDSTLFYGAAPNLDEGMSAHVWVRDGDTFVIGGEIAANFAILATYPAIDKPAASA
jgi:hypothetical protein